jgi:hypothetical protein
MPWWALPVMGFGRGISGDRFPVPFVEPLKAVGCREAILDDRSLS